MDGAITRRKLLSTAALFTLEAPSRPLATQYLAARQTYSCTNR